MQSLTTVDLSVCADLYLSATKLHQPPHLKETNLLLSLEFIKMVKGREGLPFRAIWVCWNSGHVDQHVQHGATKLQVT